MDYKNGEYSLYWRYDGYLFDLGGNIAKTESVNLTMSTKIIDLVKFVKIPATFCLSILLLYRKGNFVVSR